MQTDSLSNKQNNNNNTPKPVKEIKIGFINVRSIYPKVDQIQHIIQNHDFDIFGVNKTWLDESVTSAELTMDGYDIVRKDRNRHGGGVCVYVYVRQAITYNILFAKKDNPVENVWLNLNGAKLCFGCVYRPPSADSEYFSQIYFNRFAVNG